MAVLTDEAVARMRVSAAAIKKAYKTDLLKEQLGRFVTNEVGSASIYTELAVEKELAKLAVEDLEGSIAGIEAELLVKAAESGSNDTQRKANLAMFKKESPELVEANKALKEAKRALALLEGKKSGMFAELQALQATAAVARTELLILGVEGCDA